MKGHEKYLTCIPEGTKFALGVKRVDAFLRAKRILNWPNSYIKGNLRSLENNNNNNNKRT